MIENHTTTQSQCQASVSEIVRRLNLIYEMAFKAALRAELEASTHEEEEKE